MKPLFTFQLTKALLCGAFVLSAVARAQAADQATAQMTDLALGGGEFQYTITLDNTGSNNLETFWYSWVPGKDFLPSSPTNIVSPTGWTDNITHGGSTDGYAIQWLTSSAPVTPGSTLSFSFDSTSTPSTLAGDSPFYPTTPIGTSFVYSGAPFSDAGFQFDVQSDLESAPEPSTWSLALLAGIGWVLLSRRSLKFFGQSGTPQ